jgi:uncharacterized protein (TIGR02145 family)
MKKFLFSLILLLVSYVGFSQKGLSYQAVILDPAKIEIPGQDISSQPLVNGNVWLKFSIYNGSTLQFEEVHKTKTDNYGLVNLLIGSVSATSFNSLVWDSSQKSLYVYASFNQGSSYIKVSEQKLTYNPYALFAETAGKLSGVLPVANGGTGATTAADARANLGLDQVNKPVSTATKAALDLKTNAADVTAALALKANTADVTSALDLKANTSDVNASLDLKANKTDMTAALAAKADTGTIKTFVVTQVAAATIADADANSKGKIKLAGDLGGTADAPSVPGLALKANTSDMTSALALKADAADVTTALASKANGANVSASLSLKEDAANKSLNVYTDGASDIKYPSVKAVKDYVDGQVTAGVASATIADANLTTKGKIQLAGDLGGTAAVPTVPGLALKANAIYVTTALNLKANSVDLLTLTSNVNSSIASLTTSLLPSNIKYVLENGTNGQILSSLNSGTLTWTTPTSYTMPIASQSTIGGIVVGANLSIDNNGVLSASSSGIPYTGATNAVDLGAYDLTVNGLTIGRGPSNGGTNNNTNTALGYQVMIGQNGAGGGSRNTAVGSQAARYMKDGADNTAIGFSALGGSTNPIWSDYNTAIGSYSLSNTQCCNGRNTGVGYSSLQNTTGSYNTSLGYNSGTDNTSGTFNTIIGANANVSSGALSNATAIGGGAIVTASNTIQLGSNSVTNVNTSGTLTAGNINTGGTISAVSINSSGTLTAGQMTVGAAVSPVSSAVLEASSTTKGFLPPRMTTAQRDAISSAASGLVIFNTTTNGLEFKASTGWVSITTSSPAGSSTPTVAVFLPTIVIGNQQWMSENLEVMTYRNGDVIPYVSDQSTWDGLTTGAWCYYNNDPANGPIYGKLYNWYAVNDSRGLAPTGWHIPTDAEWTALSTKLGVRSGDDSGFQGLLGGRRTAGSYVNNGSYGYWWSSEQNNNYPPNYPSAYIRYQGPGGGFARSWNNKPEGVSVRCIRD